MVVHVRQKERGLVGRRGSRRGPEQQASRPGDECSVKRPVKQPMTSLVAPAPITVEMIPYVIAPSPILLILP